MKKFVIITGLLFICYIVPAWGWSYGEFISCNALNPMPTIVLKTSYGQLVYDLNLSGAEITAKNNNYETGLINDGLATQSISSSISLKKYTIKQLDKNNTCVLPAEVEVAIGYNNPEIYVSKDIKMPSCRFSVVIRHEQVHQRINKLVLDYFLPLFFEEIKAAVADVKAIKISHSEEYNEGAQALLAFYRERLNPVIAMYQEIVKTEHQKLDNLTNYQMEWALCKNFEQGQLKASSPQD